MTLEAYLQETEKIKKELKALIEEGKILEQLRAIRDSGEANMMDRRLVQKAANDRLMFDLVAWIEENNRKDYFDMLKKL